MSEFIFDGLSPAIRTILDDSFRRGKPSYDDAELQRFLVEVPFSRDMETNLIVFRKLVEAVMAKPEFQKERSKSDGWLAPRIHNALRLTRREAARKEFWIGLIFQNLDYLWWRFEASNKKAIGLDRVLGSDSRMAFSQIWWAAELLRESDNYTLVSKASSSSDLGMYFQPLDIFHSKPLSFSLGNLAFNNKSTHYFNISISQILNYCINCFVRDDIAPSTAPEMNAIKQWIHEPPNLETLLADELPQGPPESSIPASDVDEISRFVQFVAEQGVKSS